MAGADCPDQMPVRGETPRCRAGFDPNLPLRSPSAMSRSGRSLPFGGRFAPGAVAALLGSR